MDAPQHNDSFDAFMEDLRHMYGVKPTSTATTAAVPLPEVLPAEDVPHPESLAIRDSVKDFLIDGVSKGGDRSRELQGAAVALFSAGLNAEEVFSVLVHSEAAMGVALDHRRQEYDRALVYLWDHHVTKARPKALGSMATADDFEDMGEGDAKGQIPASLMAPITLEELESARTSPRVLVRGFLYACVRSRIAAGGTGKTTLAMYEAAVLALGRDLWGYSPAGPVRTVVVTREDDRELLVGRLREILRALHLTETERATVLERVRIVDLSGKPFRLSVVKDDVVTPDTKAVEWLLAMLEDFRPDWVIFDPVVSFGVGESRVNDAEQGLIEAARIVKKRLDCCVELIHHTGKANAREKALDQYAGRGGSALSDGSRMVAVLQPLDAGEWLKATGTALGDGQSGLVMALPKLSYAPQQGLIYIRRSGYAFHYHQPARPKTPEEESEDCAAKLLGFIELEYASGNLHTGKTLDTCAKRLGMSRDQVREALLDLKTKGRLVEVGKTNVKGFHLRPVSLAEDGGDTPPDLTVQGEE